MRYDRRNKIMAQIETKKSPLSYRYIPTLPPQLNIERVKGEILSFSVFTYSSFILNILERLSSKSSFLVPCIEKCLPAPSISSLIGFGFLLSPSSSVGGTLRGLAPIGHIYQSEQFYISAKTTEEGLHGLNLVCMDIKIPCKSLKSGEWLNAGYKSTFGKVFYRYPFTAPSLYSATKTIAPQNYDEYSNKPRNVNSVLTFERGCNFRKIAAIGNKQVYNSLKIRTLKSNSRWNICQWNTIDDFYCLPP